MSYSGTLFDFEQKRPIVQTESVLKTNATESSLPPPTAREPVSVSELTRQIKDAMAQPPFLDILVTGQISNLSQPRSGHVYLTLKDDEAQLPAVIWKSAAMKIAFKMQNGIDVLCRGRLDVYPPQGKYQLVVTKIEEKGLGSLEKQFRRLYEKLSAEGLFDPVQKKPLPKSLRRVAVITSPTGAAIRDFLQVLGRRARHVDVLLVPVRVQGDEAAQEMAEAIERVNQLQNSFRTKTPIDAIVLTRGGGSMEDLWAFNEEVLVRAVAASELPIVSGVGHEIDVTLCDLAADIRALTPSEAAERLTLPDEERRKQMMQCRTIINQSLQRYLRSRQDVLRRLSSQAAFSQPERLWENRQQTLDLLEKQVQRAAKNRIELTRNKLENLGATLQALNPRAILQRGYSLTFLQNGKPLQSVTEIAPGSIIRTVLSDGELESVVREAAQ